MNTLLLQKLEAARAKVASLEAKVAQDRLGELSALPARFGFETVRAFISAVRAATKGDVHTKAGGRRKRARITDAVRAEVKELAEAGKTGAEIANIVGISLPSVQNIKKALGLVKARKKK